MKWTTMEPIQQTGLHLISLSTFPKREQRGEDFISFPWITLDKWTGACIKFQIVCLIRIHLNMSASRVHRPSKTTQPVLSHKIPRQPLASSVDFWKDLLVLNRTLFQNFSWIKLHINLERLPCLLRAWLCWLCHCHCSLLRGSGGVTLRSELKVLMLRWKPQDLKMEAHLYLCICVDVFYTCICTMRSRCWLWDGSRESGRWELVWKLQICSSSCHFFALLLDLWKVRCKSNANTKSHRNSRHFTEKVK